MSKPAGDRKLVEGQELMASVYKAVRVLLECPDQEGFTEHLKALVVSKAPLNSSSSVSKANYPFVTEKQQALTPICTWKPCTRA